VERSTEPVFFASPAELRAWFDRHHADRTELVVGFRRKGSGEPSITWPEAVDEALCVGWIDGVRRRLDATSYVIRFTPRRPRSTWSAVNIDRATALAEQGRMRPAGLAAFARRDEERSRIYSYERADAELAPDQAARLAANPEALAFFTAQPPAYRRAALHWVTSAKRAATRERRLDELIADSAAGRRLRFLTR
jgi:uncharacterized protein YdeI (YjbR/CyaY-like superfamily)